jgi:hypothetical protein
VDSFTTVMSGAIGIIVAALALFVGNQLPEDVKRISPALMLSAAAFFVALLSFLWTSYRHLAIPGKGRWFFAIATVAVIALLAAILILELRRAELTFKERPSSPLRQSPVPAK